MPRKFGKIVVASTGDHKGNKDDKIKGWVEHAGGAFVKDGLRDVTHLVCSEKAWKSYYPIVKEARRKRSVHIVKLNWLEDSLLGKSGKPLDTTAYQFEQRKVTKCGVQKRKRATEDEAGDADDDGETRALKPFKKCRNRKDPDAEDVGLSKDKRIEKAGKEFDEASAEFVQIIGERGYRPFTDQSGFTYLLTLVRKDILKNRLEKHRIKVRYAPHFSAQPSTFIPITRQEVDPRRKNSDGSASLSNSIESTDAWRGDNVPSGEPILPPCPVPVYYFPQPYPYSHNPVIATSLPRKLTSANPKLRVRIADPWAQSLQLFVSETPPENKVSGNPRSTTPSIIHHPNMNELRQKTFAAYTVYTKPGIRHVGTLVPPGSNFDFAWAMFTKFFELKTGVNWTNAHNRWKRGITFEKLMSEKRGGHSGTVDSGLWDVLEPPMAMRDGSGDKQESVESTDTTGQIPSMTVVLNMTKVAAADQLEARANTPEEGW